jgi:flagellar protein FliS
MTYSKKHKAISQYGRGAAESEVDFASPHRLVQMLIEGALEKLAIAKGCMDRKDYKGKADHLTWASSIINGLRCSLDTNAGGAIANNLNDLYGYMLRRLMDASLENNSEIVDEVSGLLVEIKSAWDAMPEGVRNPDAGVSGSVNTAV